MSKKKCGLMPESALISLKNMVWCNCVFAVDTASRHHHPFIPHLQYKKKMKQCRSERHHSDSGMVVAIIQSRTWVAAAVVLYASITCKSLPSAPPRSSQAGGELLPADLSPPLAGFVGMVPRPRDERRRGKSKSRSEGYRVRGTWVTGQWRLDTWRGNSGGEIRFEGSWPPFS